MIWTLGKILNRFSSFRIFIVTSYTQSVQSVFTHIKKNQPYDLRYLCGFYFPCPQLKFPFFFRDDEWSVTSFANRVDRPTDRHEWNMMTNCENVFADVQFLCLPNIHSHDIDFNLSPLHFEKTYSSTKPETIDECSDF